MVWITDGVAGLDHGLDLPPQLLPAGATLVLLLALCIPIHTTIHLVYKVHTSTYSTTGTPQVCLVCHVRIPILWVASQDLRIPPQTYHPTSGPETQTSRPLVQTSGPQTPRADPSDPLLHLGSGEPSRVSVDQSGTREVLKLTDPLEALLGYPVRPPFPGLAASKWYTRKGPKTLNLQILRVPSEGSQTPRF